jgi:hypothetical protein
MAWQALFLDFKPIFVPLKKKQPTPGYLLGTPTTFVTKKKLHYIIQNLFLNYLNALLIWNLVEHCKYSEVAINYMY